MKVENVKLATIFSCYNETMGRMSEMIIREGVTRICIITSWGIDIQGLVYSIRDNRIVIFADNGIYESIHYEDIGEVFYIK